MADDDQSKQIAELQKQVLELQEIEKDMLGQLDKLQPGSKKGELKTKQTASATALDYLMGDRDGDGVNDALGDFDNDGILDTKEKLFRKLLLNSGFKADESNKDLFPPDHEKGYYNLVNAVAELDETEEHPQLKEATAKCDIKPDVWGAFIYILVNDMPDMVADLKKGLKAVLCNNVERNCRVSLTFLLFLANVFFQGMMVFNVLQKILMPSWKDTQELYGTFHEKVYSRDGGQWKFDAKVWEDDLSDGDKSNMCGMAVAMGLFLRVILFLWVATNLQELIKNSLQQKAIWSLPEVDAPQLMVADLKEEGKTNNFLICITKPSRWSLVILVCYAKTCIAVFLTLAGCLWLTAATSVGDLILNSLALAFVVQIDELLATTFLPHFYIAKLDAFSIIVQHSDDPYQPFTWFGKLTSLCGVKMALYKERGEGAIEKYVWDGEEKEPEEEKTRKETLKNIFGYMECAFWFFAVFAFVEVCVDFQPVLPGYKGDITDHCYKFLSTQTPECYPVWMHVLSWPFQRSSPIPWDQDCFPYGEGTH